LRDRSYRPERDGAARSAESFEQFQADQMSCQQYASATIGGASVQENAANSAAANALVGTAIARRGRHHRICDGFLAKAPRSAPDGAAFGSAAGSSAYGYSYYEAQRHYDMAYTQCMYARGNQIPGRVAYRAPPARTTAPAYPPPNYPPPNLSQGSAPSRTAAPQLAPPASNVPPGYGTPSGAIAPGPAVPVAPPRITRRGAIRLRYAAATRRDVNGQGCGRGALPRRHHRPEIHPPPTLIGDDFQRHGRLPPLVPSPSGVHL
jgi:hypothetical protein